MNAVSATNGRTKKREGASRSTRRMAELFGVFVALPFLVRLNLVPAPQLAVLLLVAAGCAVALWRDPTFDRSRLFSLRGIRGSLAGIAVRAAAVAACVFGLARALHPPPVSPGSHPALWILGLALYPFLSAWPQEVLYRVFFFHRYAALFRRRWSLIAVNALLFGYLHIVFSNLVAPLLSVPAGVLLALTYERKGSIGPVWIEHTLYGLSVFALGLGAYFFEGGR